MTNGETGKALIGILVIGILAIMAMTKGFNGEIMKYAIGAIVILAVGEKAVDYYSNKGS